MKATKARIKKWCQHAHLTHELALNVEQGVLQIVRFEDEKPHQPLFSMTEQGKREAEAIIAKAKEGK